MALPTQPIDASVQDLHWIAGHWQGDYVEGWGEELWSAPYDNVILGTTRCHDAKGLLHTDLTCIVQKHHNVQSVLRRFGRHFNPIGPTAEPIYFDLVDLGPHHAVFYNSEAEGGAWMHYQRKDQELVGTFYLGSEVEPLHSYRFQKQPH